MKQDGILEFFDGANSPSTTPKGSCLSKKDEDAEVSTQSLYVVRDGFFVKTDEKWEKVRYDEILWVRAFENGSVMFLTNERSLMVNHRLWRIEEMLTEHPNFVRINRSEIVNLDVIDGFEGNCYYIGKNPLYATGVYRQRMEGVFIKAAIKRGQKSLLILLSVSRLGRRPRRSSSSYTPCAHVS